MAAPVVRQWLAAGSAVLLAAVPQAPSAGIVPVTFDCGPGYHKPPHGQCVPDAGRPLLRFNRYPAAERALPAATKAPVAGAKPTQLRDPAPWGR